MLEINKIYHGNCLELMKHIDDNSIQCTITSPPYHNTKEYSKYDSLQHYLDIMEKAFIEVLRVLEQGRMCIVNISPVIVKRESRSKQSYRISLPFHFVVMMEKIGFEFLEDIIWKKPEGSVPNRNAGFFRHRKPVAYKPNIITEYILVFKKPAQFLIDKSLRNNSLVQDGYERTNVWEFNPETNSEHPAPFPEGLPERCIRYYSYEKDIILDPFIGSGTTAVVSKRNNRNFIGIEKEKSYVEIAERRLSQKLLTEVSGNSSHK